MTSNHKEVYRSIAKQLKEISQKIQHVYQICRQQDISPEKEESNLGGDDSVTSLKRKRKPKRLKKAEKEVQSEQNQINSEVCQLASVLTEEEYYEALSKFIVQQRQAIKHRYPTFKKNEIATVALQCFNELKPKQQNTIIKTMMSTKKQFSVLVPEEKKAIHNFFDELKKSKSKEFLKKPEEIQEKPSVEFQQLGKNELVPLKNPFESILLKKEHEKSSPVKVIDLDDCKSDQANCSSEKIENQIEDEKNQAEGEQLIDEKQKEVEFTPDCKDFEKEQVEIDNYCHEIEYTENANSDSMHMNFHQELSAIEEVQENSRLTYSQPTNTRKRDQTDDI